jgi:filamentous hemagglutinin
MDAAAKAGGGIDVVDAVLGTSEILLAGVLNSGVDAVAGLVGLGAAGLGGLAGLLGIEGVASGAELGTNTINSIKEFAGYELKSEGGNEVSAKLAESIGEYIQAYEDGNRSRGDATLDATGWPILATGAYMAPEVLMAVAGGFLGKALKNAGKGSGPKTNGFDLSKVEVLTLKEAKQLSGENRGLIFVQENTAKSSSAAKFENGTTGAFSDVPSQSRAVPALRFDHPNPNGNRTNNFVRFDGVEADGVTLIDRKLSLTSKSDQIKSLQRVSEALHQNSNYNLVYEFPTQKAADRAMDILFKQSITNIDVRVAQ